MWRVNIDTTRANPVSGSALEPFSPSVGGYTSPVGWNDISFDGERALGTLCRDNRAEVQAAQRLSRIDLLQGWRNEVLQRSESRDAGR